MPAGLPQRVLRALADSRTAEEAIDATLAQIAASLGAPVAELWLRGEQEETLLWAGDFATDPALGEFRDRSRHLTFGQGDGLPGRVTASGEPELVGDLIAHPGFARTSAAAEVGLTSAIAAPLNGYGGPIGAVVVFATAQVELGPEQLDALDGAARQLAAYLGRARIEQRLKVSEERNEAIVKSALDCVITMDHTGRVLDFNPAAESVFGYTRDEAVGSILAELIIPPERRPAHHQALGAYLDRGEKSILDSRLELEAMRSDGSRLPVELAVTRLGPAEPPMFVGFVRDISDRRTADAERERLLADAMSSRALAEAAQTRSVAAKEQAEEAGRRLAVLARVGERLLAADNDGELSDEVIAEVVPELAEWCEITLTEPRRPPRVTASAGERPPYEDQLRVPLRTVRGELGTIAFALRSQDAASVARTLAARVSLALDNTRLLTERSHIAETLQRSLLPATLPSPPGLEVAARYRAAGAENLVGGDFYDFFQSRDGVWTAILGDVSGKGPEAAAITALSRHTLRAGAFREASPKANLLLLNEALLAATDRDWRFATVIYARICRDDSGATVTVSTGGHLPPIIRRADGGLEHVPVRGTVIGSVPEPMLEDHEVRLGRGDVLLLYTDGVTEVRPRQPSWGDDLLLRTLAAHGGGPLEDLVEAIERAAVDAQDGAARDDIALFALRPSG